LLVPPPATRQNNVAPMWRAGRTSEVNTIRSRNYCYPSVTTTYRKDAKGYDKNRVKERKDSTDKIMY